MVGASTVLRSARLATRWAPQVLLRANHSESCHQRLRGSARLPDTATVALTRRSEMRQGHWLTLSCNGMGHLLSLATPEPLEWYCCQQRRRLGWHQSQHDYEFLSKALKTSLKRIQDEMDNNVKPPGSIELSNEQFEQFFPQKGRKWFFTVNMILMSVALFGIIAYFAAIDWLEDAVPKVKIRRLNDDPCSTVVFDRYGRRIDPETGERVPRLV